MHTGKNIISESVHNLRFMTSPPCEWVTTDSWRRLTISWNAGCFMRDKGPVAWGWPFIAFAVQRCSCGWAGLKFVGFVSGFCVRQGILYGSFMERTAWCALKHDVSVPHTCTSSLPASGYYCTYALHCQAEGSDVRPLKINKLQSRM